MPEVNPALEAATDDALEAAVEIEDAVLKVVDDLESPNDKPEAKEKPKSDKPDAAREAQKLRARLREAESQRDEVKTRLEQLETRQRDFDLGAAFNAFVGDKKNGVKEPSLVRELVKPENLNFENGTVAGLDKEIERVRKSFPQLFYVLPGSANGGANNLGKNNGVATGSAKNGQELLREAYAENEKP